jgi:hypothetical protein
MEAKAAPRTDKRNSTGDYWDRDGMGIRVPVLHIALMIESKATWAVDFLLSDNKVLGSLINWDFNKRIQFLSMLDALTADEKARFKLFAEIRNKMIHELEAKSLVDCFQLMGVDPQDKILNIYPQDKSLPMEKRLYEAVQDLIDHLGDLLEKIEKFVLESTKDAKAAHASKGYEIALLTCGEVASAVSDRLAAHLKAGSKMSAQEVALIPFEVMEVTRFESEKKFRVHLLEKYGVDVAKAEAEGGPSQERA